MQSCNEIVVKKDKYGDNVFLKNNVSEHGDMENKKFNKNKKEMNNSIKQKSFGIGIYEE